MYVFPSFHLTRTNLLAITRHQSCPDGLITVAYTSNLVLSGYARSSQMLLKEVISFPILFF